MCIDISLMFNLLKVKVFNYFEYEPIVLRADDDIIPECWPSLNVSFIAPTVWRINGIIEHAAFF